MAEHLTREVRMEVPDVGELLRSAEEISGAPEGERLVLNMGPSHPSTHGVFQLILELDGEVITKAIPEVGYLHRGDEKIAENMHYTQFVPYTDRLDYLAPLANNVVYACAVEKLLGWEIPPRAQVIRVICAEIARISSHLMGLGAYAMDCGAVSVFLYTFTEREKIYTLIEELTGARFTTTYTRIGGLSRDLPPGWPEKVKEFVKQFLPKVDEIEGLLTKNKIFVDRTQNIGVISKEDAIDYGLTGPNLRGSGVNHDLRKKNPYLGYEKYDFEVPLGSVGDCFDRYMVRIEEMRQSCRILEQALSDIPMGPIAVDEPRGYLPKKADVLTKMEELIQHFIIATQGVNAPVGEVYFGGENPKGELGFYIVSKGGGVPYRLKIRSPSFVNLSILPKILPGHLLSDVVAILGSLDFVMGECDR
ncbi:NADH dehydrogenase (quinone) subunit D [Candidatus Methylacidiphilum fumarolicum]|uniref:NADH-quinone oxidoreductase subunit D n=2 Tax=Candidatus Methylacidiphilum fumarolicum TaxID=591154 RepID=I0JVR0_METFB|nr:NADH dehydrogenase (quinone) subunit D [Candidatus Methylacidiphilum fumarolicum]MBW6414078.1 NADH dehydrogenase (quinone) subunit D [Candidatus Methylacidiphilum fumarolicum]TFE66427.1 NADH dehydrogenase (quinone) subunit D [Candidatus Methylacidiphilum fumarolicum]TFE75236.1 NADH dehydrogenase (quinone) subunit D [Candidatus Methylacidiphilum fumarolicum]TFE76152.1 NADH dehydrogenase (quinone) subunit D [Candidatus Methylacidiphilum fumarolicum]TFE77300.1 NADH dehydrogenase (quinone) subu